MIKLKGLEFLNNDNIADFELKKAIVENKPHDVFNTDEFQYNIELWDYISYKNVNTAIDLITDLVGLAGAKFDTGNQKANEFIEQMITNGLGIQLEKYLKQIKEFGNAYMQVTVEEDLSVNEESKKICTYLINPNIVYADFDKYNPNREARSYSVVYEKTEDNQKITLVITFKAGAIEYRCFIQKEDRQFFVNPMDYFPELFPEDFEGDVVEEAIIVTTPFKYNLLQAVHYKKELDSFYGIGDIDSSVVSKINSINRLANLAMEVVIDNSQPKFQVSSSTGRVVRQTIDEVTKGGGAGDQLTTALDLKATPKNTNNRFKRTINFWEQQVANLFGKKSMILEAEAGE